MAHYVRIISSIYRSFKRQSLTCLFSVKYWMGHGRNCPNSWITLGLDSECLPPAHVHTCPRRKWNMGEGLNLCLDRSWVKHEKYPGWPWRNKVLLFTVHAKSISFLKATFITFSSVFTHENPIRAVAKDRPQTLSGTRALHCSLFPHYQLRIATDAYENFVRACRFAVNICPAVRQVVLISLQYSSS